MYELDDALDHEWIRSLLATGLDAIAEGDGIALGAAAALSRDQMLAAGRARLARRRLSAAMVLAVMAVLAVTGYLIGNARAGAPGGHGAVTASVTPSLPVRNGPALGTDGRIDPSPTPSAS